MLTRARRPRGEGGTTLAELVVCMALTTLVGAMALGFFVFAGRSTRGTTGDSFAQQGARTTMTTVGGMLRLAVAGTTNAGGAAGAALTPTRLAFSAYDTSLAGCDRRPASTITMTIASGALTLARTGPVNAPTKGARCAYTAGVSSSRVLLTGVRAGTQFTYTYGVVDGVAVVDPANVATVTLTLVVAGPSGRSQTYTTTAVVSGGTT